MGIILGAWIENEKLVQWLDDYEKAKCFVDNIGNEGEPFFETIRDMAGSLDTVLQAFLMILLLNIISIISTGFGITNCCRFNKSTIGAKIINENINSTKVRPMTGQEKAGIKIMNENINSTKVIPMTGQETEKEGYSKKKDNVMSTNVPVVPPSLALNKQSKVSKAEKLWVKEEEE